MQDKKKLIVYVGSYSFPNGGAAARRIYGNCVTLKKAGYDVIVTSGQVSTKMVDEYNGIQVISLNERLYEKLPTVLKHLMYFNAGKKTIEWLDNLTIKPAAIILYSGYSPYLIKLIPWCRKNNVKIIFDAVEWYDAPSRFHYFISPYYLNIELAMRWLNKKCDSLIVISDYLKDYYTGTVDSLVKIPPTVNCESIGARLNHENSKTIKLVYAGNPGKKDLLALIIKAVQNITMEGNKVQLHVAGVTSDNLRKFLNSSSCSEEILDNFLFCHGILSHDETLELVRSADYSIIIRPPIRSVQAGFPTKFVESLAVGTPVIANITSDLDSYLIDGVNGLICSDSSLESIKATINKAFEVEDYSEMRIDARKTAESYFDAINYLDSLKKIIG
ncbi:glycosyltransferase [Psychrobacter sp. CCUG 69069]|uniref:glycosyltransferase n=1 Tax=Psychrobacter sp. CCUG 69069 TaxID=2282777 RepID=UPI001E4D560A|nr:glycosyltransferase [Psychrobacter sp. CCUG 69069]